MIAILESDDSKEDIYESLIRYLKNKMKEITSNEAKARNLKLIGNLMGNNLSQAVCMLERFKEKDKIKYYSVNFIVLDEETHNGQISISFWN